MGILPHVAYLLGFGAAKDQELLTVPEEPDGDAMGTSIGTNRVEPDHYIGAEPLVNVGMLRLREIKHSVFLHFPSEI